MRIRSILLLTLAIVLAVGTAWLAQKWLTAQRAALIAQSGETAPKPARSVLIARTALHRGQILRPEELIWQVWPDGALDKNYIELGGPRDPDSFAGWVAKNPIAAGDPITEEKIIAPGDRGFLAAVLTPGMRAISVPVTDTSAVDGFIHPGDRVDLVLSYKVPMAAAEASETKDYDRRASQTVMRDVRLIGIDKQLDVKPGEAVQPHTATLEVTPKQGETIALAGEIGKVALTLRSLVPAPEAGDEGPERLTDSRLAEAASITLDSDISPLFPKIPSAAAAPGADFGGPNEEERKQAYPCPVTILRGKSNKPDIVNATCPMEKAS
ncbi:MAG: Flp pilus assembly protein CpaB [Alphaproteobacteria bacterium]